MGGSGEATLIDPAALEETGVVDLGEELEFAVADGKGHVFVNATQSATIIAVDAASRKIIGHWKMEGCEDPSGLAYSEAANALLSAVLAREPSTRRRELCTCRRRVSARSTSWVGRKPCREPFNCS
jgi:hypothetical protein